MSEKLKDPTDYPPIYFRVSKEEKVEIEALVNEILKHRLREHVAGTRLPRRNKLIVEALTLGLEQIKRKIKKS